MWIAGRNPVSHTASTVTSPGAASAITPSGSVVGGASVSGFGAGAIVGSGPVGSGTVDSGMVSATVDSGVVSTTVDSGVVSTTVDSGVVASTSVVGGRLGLGDGRLGPGRGVGGNRRLDRVGVDRSRGHVPEVGRGHRRDHAEQCTDHREPTGSSSYRVHRRPPSSRRLFNRRPIPPRKCSVAADGAE